MSVNLKCFINHPDCGLDTLSVDLSWGISRVRNEIYQRGKNVFLRHGTSKFDLIAYAPRDLKRDSDEAIAQRIQANYKEWPKLKNSATVQSILGEGEPDEDLVHLVFIVRESAGRTPGTSVEPTTQASSRKKRKPDGDAKPLPENDMYDFREEQDKAVKRVRGAGVTASKAAKELLAHVQRVAPVYNGLPASNTGPPIELFHPVFDNFKRYLRDTDEIPADIQYLAWKYSEACVAIYDAEVTRENELKETLERVLHLEALHVQASQVNSDRVGIQSVGHSEDRRYQAIIYIEEIKNRLGQGGSDPYDQGCFAYQRYWGDPAKDVLRSVCYCPTFIIASAGQWMCVSGGVYVTDAIVQPLTTGYEWVGPVANTDVRRRRFERLFFALRKALLDLTRYYTSLSDFVRDPVQQQIHGFPHITECDEFKFSYVAKLIPFMKDKLVFKAKRQDNGDLVVVKFTGAYCEEAHHLLADNGYAPALYYIGKTLHDLYMVVMQYVEGTLPLDGGLTETQCEDVGKAIELLHAKGIDFGDLRRPNVLVKDDDKHALLLDFDGCGKDGEGRYPFDINMALSWANGVEPGGIMKKKHDLEMLGKL